MRIAILYICTGRYTLFWEKFYNSCEAFFLPGHERHYFVFTDGEISPAPSQYVHKQEQAFLGWPNDTLKRFHMFCRIREQLASFDYIFFFNANCEFLRPVDESVLPHEEGLVVTQHPGFYNKSSHEFAYDRNPASRACIPEGQGAVYVCGGINGGRADAYIKLIDELCAAVDEDEKNGVTALWHDESHLNRYILERPYKLLSPSYCYPEGWDIPFTPVIQVRDKQKHGGHNLLRNIPEKHFKSLNIIQKFRSKWRQITHK